MRTPMSIMLLLPTIVAGAPTGLSGNLTLTMKNATAVEATMKLMNVPCSPTTSCPDGDICCTACDGCCPSGTTCDCSAGTCDTADGAKVSMKAFIKLMTEVA